MKILVPMLQRGSESKLDLADQLLLLEQVWDSISSRQAEFPIPQWQQDELAQRRKELEEGRHGLLDSEGVHAELRNRYL